MGNPTHHPAPGEPARPDDDRSASHADKPDKSNKPGKARGTPGSFDQPEPNDEVMPRAGGPHPKQTAEVPLGTDGDVEPPDSHGHNSAAVRRKHLKKDSKTG